MKKQVHRILIICLCVLIVLTLIKIGLDISAIFKR